MQKRNYKKCRNWFRFVFFLSIILKLANDRITEFYLLRLFAMQGIEEDVFISAAAGLSNVHDVSCFLDLMVKRLH